MIIENENINVKTIDYNDIKVNNIIKNDDSNSFTLRNCDISISDLYFKIDYDKLIFENCRFISNISDLYIYRFSNVNLSIEELKFIDCSFESEFGGEFSIQISINVKELVFKNCTNLKNITFIGMTVENIIIDLNNTNKNLHISNTTINHLMVYSDESNNIFINETDCYNILKLNPDSVIETRNNTSNSINFNHGIFGRTLDHDIIAYKKVRYYFYDDNSTNASECILELKIPKHSLIHTDMLGGKCRADKCIPLKAYSLKGNAINHDTIIKMVSIYDGDFEYRFNEEILPDSFNYGYNECSSGIHFFLNKNQAINF